MTSPLRRPVFIVGSPRSGTTLLSHLLLSAGGFAILRTELRAFNILGPRFGNLLTPADRTAFVEEFTQGEIFKRSGLDPLEFGRSITESCTDTGDFVRIMMDAMCAQQGAERWSECTPENVVYVDQIKRAFPEALFIHMVRDGRDVATSIAGRGMIHPRRGDESRAAAVSAVLWEWFVLRGRAFQRRHPQSFLEIRFEDLVGDRAATLAEVAEFIDQPLDVEHIAQVGLGCLERPNTSFKADFDKGNFSPVGRWKDTLAPRDLSEIEGLVGPTLKRLGYELSGRPRASDWFFRKRYRLLFSLRWWLKTHTPLGRRVDTSPLHEFAPEPPDPSLRPGDHREWIAAVVAGSVPPTES